VVFWVFGVAYILLGLAAFCPVYAARSKARRDAGRSRPPHPVGAAVPTPPPGGTTTTPPPDPNSYTVRIYDYSVVIAPHIQYAANYYQNLFTAAGKNVTVQYIDSANLDYTTCQATTPPLTGIRVCERPDDVGGFVASSTGPIWVSTGTHTWDLYSTLQYFASNVSGLETCDTCGGVFTPSGDYLACHEMGHSFGLSHRTDAQLPRSCMGGPTFAPPYLAADEIALLLANLPT